MTNLALLKLMLILNLVQRHYYQEQNTLYQISWKNT